MTNDKVSSITSFPSKNLKLLLKRKIIIVKPINSSICSETENVILLLNRFTWFVFVNFKIYSYS